MAMDRLLSMRMLTATRTICLTFIGVCSAFQIPKDPPRRFKLRAESARFWKLLDRRTTLQRVAGDFGFTEGPVWDPRGFLYVSDEEQNRIFRLYPVGRREVFFQTGDPDGSTLDRDHELVTTASVLRAVVKVRPDGALYFTDPTLDLPKGDQQEIPFQGVYRLGTDGTVRLLTRELTQPNGLAFSPDGKHLYIDDSERRDIRVYDVEI